MSGLEIAFSSYIRYRFIEMRRLVADSMKNPEIEQQEQNYNHQTERPLI